jgi:hypothetical protein
MGRGMWQGKSAEKKGQVHLRSGKVSREERSSSSEVWESQQRRKVKFI